jgi:hypothetical protein
MGANSLGGCSQVSIDDLLLQTLHIFIPFLFDRLVFFGIAPEACTGFRAQLRALVKLLVARENGTGKCQAGLFTALTAIGFIKQVKDFHRVFGMRHRF